MDRTMFAIKYNNCATNDPCAICGQRTGPGVGPELFLTYSWVLVCWECGRKYAPELVWMLEHQCGISNATPSPGSHAFQYLPEDEQKCLLLTKYAEKKPTTFGQLDAFVIGKDGGDDVMRPDPDGDCLMGGITTDLMDGADVRILIRRGTSGVNAVRLIGKLVEWLESDPEIVTNGLIKRDGETTKGALAL